MKEINLEEIWLNAVETENVNGKTCWDIGRTAMLDFGKKLLELAAENATTLKDDDPYMDFYTIDRQSILNTINQVK